MVRTYRYNYLNKRSNYRIESCEQRVLKNYKKERSTNKSMYYETTASVYRNLIYFTSLEVVLLLFHIFFHIYCFSSWNMFIMFWSLSSMVCVFSFMFSHISMLYLSSTSHSANTTTFTNRPNTWLSK